jgi:hypothetical protein
MRWNSSGNSAAGLAAYFSVSLSMASRTMSSAASSSRTGEHGLLESAAFDIGEEARFLAAEARIGGRSSFGAGLWANVGRSTGPLRSCCSEAIRS